jgi:hypothetical protein
LNLFRGLDTLFLILITTFEWEELDLIYVKECQKCSTMTVVLSTNIIQGLAVEETEGWLQNKFLIYGFLSDLYPIEKYEKTGL